MKRKDETPLEPAAEGDGQNIGDADNYRLSNVERKAVRQGIDAVRLGSFAPEEEMEEFFVCVATISFRKAAEFPPSAPAF